MVEDSAGERVRIERERRGMQYELSEYWKKSVMILVEPERVIDLVLSLVAILPPNRRDGGGKQWKTTNLRFCSLA